MLEFRSSVLSGGLFSSEKLRLGSLGSVARGKATLVSFRGRFLSTLYGLFSTRSAPLYPLRIFSIFSVSLDHMFHYPIRDSSSKVCPFTAWMVNQSC
jgi:hypothetical protein